MLRNPRILAFVMAGGEGSRLHPLTADRCKPAVPFHGQHRIVDFVLANLINSGIDSIYLLVQYKSQSLIEHVRRSWATAPFRPDQFVSVVPPQMRNGPQWFRGTADSVAQNLHLIERFRPDIVVVFGADHIYRMDIRQMIDFHLANGAQASVATLPVPLAQCDQFGIVQIDDDHRISGFVEKPRRTRPMPGSSSHALASMGNYVFNADVLLDALRRANGTDQVDFGKHVLPGMLKSHKLMAYDFTTNVVPGTQSYEEPGYWRDVGTLDAYFDAHLDTLGPRPRFRMLNRQWPVHASAEETEPVRIENAFISRSIIGPGSVVDGARLDHALLGHSVQIDPGAKIECCIVMENTRIGRGACIRRAIVDQDNDVPPGETIGFDEAADRRRFHVTANGVVVVPACYFDARMPSTARAPEGDAPVPAGQAEWRSREPWLGAVA